MGRPGRRLGSSSAECSRRTNRQMHQTEPSDDRRKTPGSAMTAAMRRFVFEKARQPGLQAGFRIDGGPPKVLIDWIRTINVMITRACFQSLENYGARDLIGERAR